MRCRLEDSEYLRVLAFSPNIAAAAEEEEEEEQTEECFWCCLGQGKQTDERMQIADPFWWIRVRHHSSKRVGFGLMSKHTGRVFPIHSKLRVLVSWDSQGPTIFGWVRVLGSSN